MFYSTVCINYILQFDRLSQSRVQMPMSVACFHRLHSSTLHAHATTLGNIDVVHSRFNYYTLYIYDFYNHRQVRSAIDSYHTLSKNTPFKDMSLKNEKRIRPYSLENNRQSAADFQCIPYTEEKCPQKKKVSIVRNDSYY